MLIIHYEYLMFCSVFLGSNKHLIHSFTVVENDHPSLYHLFTELGAAARLCIASCFLLSAAAADLSGGVAVSPPLTAPSVPLSSGDVRPPAVLRAMWQ